MKMFSIMGVLVGIGCFIEEDLGVSATKRWEVAGLVAYSFSKPYPFDHQRS